MDPIAEFALEAVSIEERHEDLEVFFLPVMRCRRHQEEVATMATDHSAQVVSLRELDLGAKNVATCAFRRS
jgi:hypothetical protein